MISHFSNVSAAEWWRFATLKSWHWNKTEGMALTGQRRSSAENALSPRCWKYSAFPQKRQWCLAGAFSQCRQYEELRDSAFSSMRQWSGLSGWVRPLFSMPGLTIVVERLAAPNRARVIWSVRVNASRLCKQAGMSAYWGNGVNNAFNGDVLNNLWRIENKFPEL